MDALRFGVSAQNPDALKKLISHDNELNAALGDVGLSGKKSLLISGSVLLQSGFEMNKKEGWRSAPVGRPSTRD